MQIVKPRFGGTSPPIRGIPGRAGYAGFAGRNIPAHTGNSKYEGGHQAGATEHPRPYGEFRHMGVAVANDFGTSPPIRGIPFLRRGLLSIARNIPAHTGNSSLCNLKGQNGAEHPRPYGEFMQGNTDTSTGHGTSPPIRGIRRVLTSINATDRNIPAHTGNSANWSSRFVTASEHPRPYGEFSPRQRRRERQRGTSPPIRGILSGCAYCRRDWRNIPAHTGNSTKKPLPTSRASEHPRPYGEFGHGGVLNVTGRGTSPPIRGIPCRCWGQGC